MNGYICLYNGKKTEVYTDKGSYAAQILAAEKLKVTRKNQYKISVHLCEVDGNPVTHKPDF